MLARHDTVGGEDVIYSEVDNLKELKVAFNPLNILMSTKIDTLFRGFGIDITQKIAGGGQNTISMNSETGDMEIEVFEVTKDLYVQIQVASRVEELGVGITLPKMAYCGIIGRGIMITDRGRELISKYLLGQALYASYISFDAARETQQPIGSRWTLRCCVSPSLLAQI